jgi:hypothetical protein
MITLERKNENIAYIERTPSVDTNKKRTTISNFYYRAYKKISDEYLKKTRQSKTYICKYIKK